VVDPAQSPMPAAHFPISAEYNYKLVFMRSWPIIELTHLRTKINIWTAIILFRPTAYPTARIKSLSNYNNISFPRAQAIFIPIICCQCPSCSHFLLKVSCSICSRGIRHSKISSECVIKNIGVLT
jgi:hypothetical protein